MDCIKVKAVWYHKKYCTYNNEQNHLNRNNYSKHTNILIVIIKKLSY